MNRLVCFIITAYSSKDSRTTCADPMRPSVTTHAKLQGRGLHSWRFSPSSQTVCMKAHPNNQQQVIPKVDPKIMAQMHKVILQQVCICNAPIPRVHLQRNTPKLCSWPYLHARPMSGLVGVCSRGRDRIDLCCFWSLESSAAKMPTA